jgi:sigma-B regulation protein RsbU (phosphoserine phosphatase)
MVIPARQVGGDYFDYFQLDDNRFGITLADVSGKGVPGSIRNT